MDVLPPIIIYLLFVILFYLNTVMLNKHTSNHQVTFVTRKHLAVLFFRENVLLKRFHMNGHTIGFHSQIQNLE